MTVDGEFTLGVDLAQGSFQVALAPQGSRPDPWRDLPNTYIAHPPDHARGVEQLPGWLAVMAPRGRCARVVAESTGKLSQRFATALRGHGLPEVCIVNPHRPKALAHSLGLLEKTDRIDAAVLALYGLVHQPAPRTAHQALQELNRLGQAYVEELTAWRNRLTETIDPLAHRIVGGAVRQLRTKIKRIEQQLDQQLMADPVLSAQARARWSRSTGSVRSRPRP